ncbi:uroporphyrinogen-III synthase [Venturia nashicola]|nr:uroporphyrinogen-III synthase [Venturia nashicola]
MEDRIPVLLLKTKSTPGDGYEDYFNSLNNGKYEPTFVPVLEHRFRQDHMQTIRDLIANGEFGLSQGLNGVMPKYGGIIFTSQRAVEAFSQVVEWARGQPGLLNDEFSKITFYVVGPATARGLKALGLDCPISGDESGNGEALAHFMLHHYNGIWQSQPHLVKPSLLFLVGEQRRDIIPKMLQSKDLDDSRRIGVDELIVYETGEMQSFQSQFSHLWNKNSTKLQWVVVFSPTGCKAMLQCLDLLDQDTGKYRENSAGQRRPYIATIGPTTRDYLKREFNFEPDVCAEKPSPEGVGAGIAAFMAKQP